MIGTTVVRGSPGAGIRLCSRTSAASRGAISASVPMPEASA